MRDFFAFLFTSDPFARTYQIVAWLGLALAGVSLIGIVGSLFALHYQGIL